MSAEKDVMPWLLPAPDDFRKRIKSLASVEPFDVNNFRRLAATSMDAEQLRRFGEVVSTRRIHLEKAGFTPVKLGLVGSHTLDFIADALVGTGARHGVVIEIVQANYGQILQPVLDSTSPLAQSGVDAVLVMLTPCAVGLGAARFEDNDAAEAVSTAIADVKAIRSGIRNSLRSIPIFQTLAPPVEELFGALDTRMSGSKRALVQAYNRRLVEEVLEGDDWLIDVAHISALYGIDRWHDPRGWHSAKQPFTIDAVPLYADHVCRVIGAAKGKARKCLALDLDNTIWGGVIGDDGLEGIQLSQGNSVGEAHQAIQSLAKDLLQRGIILAVCSKNNDETARLPFRQHSDMLLHEADIAVFVANWNDKASNLRDIAARLNIGTDAIVFLDDNPAERAIVRQELPEVAVPEIGNDPSLYPGLLTRAGYFEAISFGQEDKQRAEYYRANNERQSAAAVVTNIEDYLTSLEMELTASHFDKQSRSRIAQLINKSNQFNLTTKRYSEMDVAAFEADPTKFTLQIRLADRFGDNGMISVIIFEKRGEYWDCDTWLMSCRVLGRRVEEAALKIVAEKARHAGALSLRGSYIPTPKNALVADHFKKLDFRKLDEDSSSRTTWELILEDYVAPKLPMHIKLTLEKTF